MRSFWLAALLAVPADAARPITPPAPEFPPRAEWINTMPLSLGKMRKRKVVLVAFIDPAGIHSIRLLPALKAWFMRYSPANLTVVGVISPSLEIEKDPAWVREEVRRLGITFPVVMDPDRSLWKGYGSGGWPTLYVVDARGRIAFERLGNGDYEEVENEIREALARVSGELPAAVDPPEPLKKDCGPATRDIAMGRGRPDAAIVARGKWTPAPDGLRLAQENSGLSAGVRVSFEAAQAMSVLAPPPGKAARFYVKLDGQWLYAGVAGKDIRYDDDGRSYVSAERERLYDLARGPDRQHTLDVMPKGRGDGIMGFSFADACAAGPLQ